MNKTKIYKIIIGAFWSATQPDGDAEAEQDKNKLHMGITLDTMPGTGRSTKVQCLDTLFDCAYESDPWRYKEKCLKKELRRMKLVGIIEIHFLNAPTKGINGGIKRFALKANLDKLGLMQGPGTPS